MSVDLAHIIYYIDFCNHHLKVALSDAAKGKKNLVNPESFKNIDSHIDEQLKMVRDNILTSEDSQLSHQTIQTLIDLQRLVNNLLKNPNVNISNPSSVSKRVYNNLSSCVSWFARLPSKIIANTIGKQQCISSSPFEYVFSDKMSSTFEIYESYEKNEKKDMYDTELYWNLLGLDNDLLKSINVVTDKDKRICLPIEDIQLMNDSQQFQWIIQDITTYGQHTYGQHTYGQYMMHWFDQLRKLACIHSNTIMNTMYQHALLQRPDPMELYEAPTPFDQKERKKYDEFQIRFRSMLAYRVMYMASLIAADEYTFQYIQHKKKQLAPSSPLLVKLTNIKTLKDVKQFRHDYGYKVNYTFGLPRHPKKLSHETVFSYLDTHFK